MIAPTTNEPKEKQKVIVVVGPTASGKTAISIKLARTIGGEIISADSRQVYRGLDIGTGKVTREEMEGIPHHLIDVANPSIIFAASDYVRLGRTVLSGIGARGKVPIIVGGTGFYIDALLGRIRLARVAPNAELRARFSGMSLAELNAELALRDPERATTIDTKNRVRVVRALEIALSPTGIIYDTSLITEKFETLWLGLTLSKEELEKKIRDRLQERLKGGMLDEAKKLHVEGLSYERMEELGLEYRYLARHMQGILTEAEMLIVLEKEIKNYAKRQMTWFKKNKDIQWFHPDDVESIFALSKDFIDLHAQV